MNRIPDPLSLFFGELEATANAVLWLLLLATFLAGALLGFFVGLLFGV